MYSSSCLIVLSILFSQKIDAQSSSNELGPSSGLDSTFVVQFIALKDSSRTFDELIEYGKLIKDFNQ
jgi:hypothetical protein